MKCFVTYIAFIGLFTTMSQFMVLVVTLLVEALPAELADKWLISCMYSCMCIQRGATVEGFTTRLAFVWFFRRVNDLVPTQSGRLSETFPAYLTDERSGARVHRHMPCKIVMRIENFPTFRTREALLFGSRDHTGCRTFGQAVR